MSSEDLDRIINNALPNVKHNALSVAYEGRGGGALDFYNEFKPGVLYNIGGVYYNNHEALNYGRNEYSPFRTTLFAMA